MRKAIKINARLCISLFVLCLIYSVLYQCQKPLEKFESKPSENIYTRTFTFNVINTETHLGESDFTLTVTSPDGTTHTYESDTEQLIVDISQYETGEYIFLIEKDNFFQEPHNLHIDNNCEDCIWNYDVTSYLTKIEKDVHLVPTKETVLTIGGNKVGTEEDLTITIVFPIGAVKEEVDVSATRIETDEERGIFATYHEHIPLKSICFQPHDYSFEKPITITFPIPHAEEIENGHIQLLMANFNYDTEEWEYHLASVKDGHATFEIQHFSVWHMIEAIKVVEEKSPHSQWESLGKSVCGESISKEYKNDYTLPDELNKYFEMEMHEEFSMTGACFTEPDTQSELQVHYVKYSTSIWGIEDTSFPLEFTKAIGTFECPMEPEIRCLVTECAQHEGGSGS